MKYTCFISYADVKEPDLFAFIEELKDALVTELKLLLDESVSVYFDKRENKPGTLFNPAIASALCQSLCLVVVYMPAYDTHTYSLREFTAMEILEQKRKEKLARPDLDDKGMIIPIILRKLKELPKQIRGQRQYVDISTFLLRAENLKTDKAYAARIQKVAEYIAELHAIVEEAQTDLCVGCNGYVLPPDEAVVPWRMRPAAVELPR